MKRTDFIKRIVGLGAGAALLPSLIKAEIPTINRKFAPVTPAEPASIINYKEMDLIPIPDGFERVAPSFIHRGMKMVCSQQKLSLKITTSVSEAIRSEAFMESLKKELDLYGYTHIHAIFATLTVYHPISFNPSKGIIVMGCCEQRDKLNSQS